MQKQKKYQMEPLRFLHIPKTAGTTFTGLLRRQYSGKPHFIFTGDEQLDRKRLQAISESGKKIALFTGHAPLITGIREADEALIITFLRDPVSRVISFCQHVSEGKTKYLRKEFPPESFNLDNFLRSGNHELSNMQARLLIEDKSAPASRLDKITPSAAKEAALENLLSKVFRFGLQEYFDESLIVFADALNWSLPLYTSLNKKNTGKLLRFEKHHIDQITELNSIDIEIYRAAREYFLNNWMKRIDHARLERFRKICRSVSLPLRLYHRVTEVAVLLRGKWERDSRSDPQR